MTLIIDDLALNGREVSRAIADEWQDRHWLRVTCWCGARHDFAKGGLTFVAVPWDESRKGEVTDGRQGTP